MAVSRKPKASSSQDPSASSASIDVDALINKGGSVPSTKDTVSAKNDDSTPVVVRIPTPILKRINEAVRSRQIKTPRHTWILEALLEKLEKESN
jgi:hypothetical protein